MAGMEIAEMADGRGRQVRRIDFPERELVVLAEGDWRGSALRPAPRSLRLRRGCGRSRGRVMCSMTSARVPAATR